MCSRQRLCQLVMSPPDFLLSADEIPLTLFGPQDSTEGILNSFPGSPLIFLMLSVLMKYHSLKELGKKGFILLMFPGDNPSISKGSQDRNSSRVGTCRQQMIQRAWMSVIYGLDHHGLLSLLS